MAVKSTPVFPQTPNFGATQITTGTGSSTVVTVYQGGVNGSKIPGFVATAVNTTGAFDVQWGVSSGGTLYLLGASLVSCSAGSSDGIPTVSMFNSSNAVGLTLDSDGNPFLFLPSSAYSLQAKTPATSSTWATGAVINLVAPSIGDF